MGVRNGDKGLERSPLQVGDVVDGKYLVEGVLGFGGMGIVLLATHVALKRRVAIKVPFVGSDDTPEVNERLVREAQAAAMLTSEHVCRVLDVGRMGGNGTPYIVMECLSGMDLVTYARSRERLPIAEAIDYLIQACDAVGEAHERRIVHRDLKPHNMFLVSSRSGRRLKVLDFGISKVRSTEEELGGEGAITTTSSFLGSPSYIAPEQIVSTREVDARADVWALGVTLYELLTGRLPFLGGSVMELALKISNDPAIPPSTLRSDIPIEIDRVVLRCLSKSPRDRFENAIELAAHLRQAAADVGLAFPTMASVDSPPAAKSELPDEGSSTATLHADTITMNGDWTRESLAEPNTEGTVSVWSGRTTENRARWRIVWRVGIAASVVAGVIGAAAALLATRLLAVPTESAVNEGGVVMNDAASSGPSAGESESHPDGSSSPPLATSVTPTLPPAPLVAASSAPPPRTSATSAATRRPPPAGGRPHRPGDGLPTIR
ncbi:MAG: protein kinase [Deltaproteobacteria bacterium]|nr:protein kinase [Deltaproteobacteria bacterium]